MPQKTAYIRFYEELNDFLNPGQVKKDLTVHFYQPPSVKDVIESFGVPHTEVDLILINGESATFQSRIGNKDRISVYPKFESIDISNITRLSNRPLRSIRFVLDVHLGKLARYLRLCGFDTLYSNHYEDRTIVRISVGEQRIILTRDVGLLKYAQVSHGYWLRSDQPEEQLREIIQRFDLKQHIRLFSRCLECNGKIKEVSREDVMEQLEEETKKYYEVVYQCESCQKIYWKGTHYNDMLRQIGRILD